MSKEGIHDTQPVQENLKLLRNGLCQKCERSKILLQFHRLLQEVHTELSKNCKGFMIYWLAIVHQTRSMPAPFVWNEKIANLIGQSGGTHEVPIVLAHADYSKPFKLYTDVSTTGLGAVLYQNQDGMDRMVA